MSLTRGLTIDALNDAIMWELGQVVGTTVSHSRFPLAQVRRKLNDRQLWFAAESQCLRRTAIIRAKSGQRQFRLPINCVDGGLISVKYFDASTTYQELDIVDQEYMNKSYEGYLVSSSSTPQRCWTGYSDGNIPVMLVDPAPDTDGTAYTAGTGYKVGSTIPTATANLTGTATSGDANTLGDTAKTLTGYGFVAGMPVWNITDGSYSFISTIATNAIELSANLAGGSDNTFTAADSYKILAGEYMAYIDTYKDDQYIFSAYPGGLASITVPADSFLIEYVPCPIEFPESGNTTMYPEIPKLYHYRGLALGVVSDFLRTFHEESKEFQRAAVYEDAFNAAIEHAKGKKESRPFKNKPTQIIPRMR